MNKNIRKIISYITIFLLAIFIIPYFLSISINNLYADIESIDCDAVFPAQDGNSEAKNYSPKPYSCVFYGGMTNTFLKAITVNFYNEYGKGEYFAQIEDFRSAERHGWSFYGQPHDILHFRRTKIQKLASGGTTDFYFAMKTPSVYSYKDSINIVIYKNGIIDKKVSTVKIDIYCDNDPPNSGSNGGLWIEHNKPTTTSNYVSLDILYSDDSIHESSSDRNPMQMRFRNEQDQDWTEWLDFERTYQNWYIPTSYDDESATQKVYIEVKDDVNHIASTSDTITKVPIIDIYHPQLNNNTLDFGSIDINSTENYAEVIVIENKGIAPLEIGQITLKNGSKDFYIDQDDCSNNFINPNDAKTFQINFQPSSGGSKSGSILIPSNDPDSKSTIIKLSGFLKDESTGETTAEEGNNGEQEKTTITFSDLDLFNQAKKDNVDNLYHNYSSVYYIENNLYDYQGYKKYNVRFYLWDGNCGPSVYGIDVITLDNNSVKRFAFMPDEKYARIELQYPGNSPISWNLNNFDECYFVYLGDTFEQQINGDIITMYISSYQQEQCDPKNFDPVLDLNMITELIIEISIK